MVASSAVCAASMHADWRLGNHPKSGDYPASGPGAMAAGADALFRRSGLADPQVTSAAYRLNTGAAEERAARGCDIRRPARGDGQADAIVRRVSPAESQP